VRELTVQNLTVTNSAVLPPAPSPSTTAVYGVFGSAGPQVLNPGAPVLIDGGVFAGDGVTNPLAGQSEFTVSEDGRYEVHVLSTWAAFAGGGLLTVFIDGVNAGQSLSAGVSAESVVGVAYPFLTAGQTFDVTVQLSLTGTSTNLVYAAIKVQKLGDV